LAESMEVGGISK